MRLSEHHLERFIFQFRLLRNTLVAWRVAVLFLILARSCWRPVTDLKALLRSLLAFFSIFLLQKLLRHNIIFHSRHSFPAQTRSVHSDCKLKSTTNLTFSLQWSESQHWSYLAFQAKYCPLRLPTNLIPLSMCYLCVLEISRTLHLDLLMASLLKRIFPFRTTPTLSRCLLWPFCSALPPHTLLPMHLALK